MHPPRQCGGFLLGIKFHFMNQDGIMQCDILKVDFSLNPLDSLHLDPLAYFVCYIALVVASLYLLV